MFGTQSTYIKYDTVNKCA